MGNSVSPVQGGKWAEGQQVRPEAGVGRRLGLEGFPSKVTTSWRGCRDNYFGYFLQGLNEGGCQRNVCYSSCVNILSVLMLILSWIASVIYDVLYTSRSILPLQSHLPTHRPEQFLPMSDPSSDPPLSTPLPFQPHPSRRRRVTPRQ